MKKISLIVILAVMMTASVFAQMGVSDWLSPQSRATLGGIRSTADDFIRPDSYVDAEFSNWFAMTSFAETGTAHLGYAKKLENLYIGAYYGGKFWAEIPSTDYTERSETLNGSRNNIRVYDKLPDDKIYSADPSNRIAILIGTADMGFRLTFFSNYRSFSDKNFLALPDDFMKDYVYERGVFTPQIAWSMAKDLTSIGIRPWVTADLNINRYYKRFERYTLNSPTDTEIQIETSDNSIMPVFNIGLGGLTVVNKDSFTGSVDLEYTLSFITYSNNEYSYPGANGKNQVRELNGHLFWKPDALDPDMGAWVMAEESSVQNIISPSFSGSWKGEKLELGFSVELPVLFRDREVAPLEINSTTPSNGNLVKDGDYVKTSEFVFSPTLRLAAQWRIVPRLALNMGGRISLNELTVTTDEYTAFVQGNKITDKNDPAYNTHKTVTTGKLTFINLLGLGVTFNPTDNLSFEASCGININSDNQISVFDTSDNGLFYFAGILALLRF